ncbi:hypothetical protein GIB23_14135 [Pseudomonas putida]|nr:hypothetical protein [Pseudomonas putida]
MRHEHHQAYRNLHGPHCDTWLPPIVVAADPAHRQPCIADGMLEQSSATRYAQAGANCFAKAVPTAGEGGLAWGNTLSAARKKSMDSCMRYASRSGGTPKTCQVVMAKCK